MKDCFTSRLVCMLVRASGAQMTPPGRSGYQPPTPSSSFSGLLLKQVSGTVSPASVPEQHEDQTWRSQAFIQVSDTVVSRRVRHMHSISLCAVLTCTSRYTSAHAWQMLSFEFPTVSFESDITLFYGRTYHIMLTCVSSFCMLYLCNLCFDCR